MHRIPANSKVRRRLFPEENGENQSKTFFNSLQESVDREKKEKSKKWNFDFSNEVPLPGPYEWFKKSGDEWIGMKVKSNVLIDDDLNWKERNKISTKQLQNEKTPVILKDDSAPLIRKRKNDENFSKDFDSDVKGTGKLLKIQFENEKTPTQWKNNDIENRIRKQGVKRKVDFDHCSYLRRLDL